jgi:hypothetical protein
LIYIQQAVSLPFLYRERRKNSDKEKLFAVDSQKLTWNANAKKVLVAHNTVTVYPLYPV